MNHHVVVLDAGTGAGEGTIGVRDTDDGQFNYPWGVAVLGDGRLAVTDETFSCPGSNALSMPLQHF